MVLSPDEEQKVIEKDMEDKMKEETKRRCRMRLGPQGRKSVRSSNDNGCSPKACEAKRL